MLTPSPTSTAPNGAAPGPALALLLLSGFRTMVDAATLELAKRGHADVRANHEFAMRAIQEGADSAVALAEKLRITKQAAAKTIATLEARGYVTRDVDPADGRRRPVLITPRGQDMLTQGQSVLDNLRKTWAKTIGEDRLAKFETVLRTLVGEPGDVIDAGAWLGEE